MDTGDREFMRELLLRHERATDAQVARLEELGREVRASTQVLLDVHAESLAQRDGILRLIDRIDRMGTGGQGV
jgi:hypothetical protein